MRYTANVKESCKKEIVKAAKKNATLRKALSRKIKEILASPHHYKPLRHELSGIRRVHILKSFVLTYAIREEENIIEFLTFTHHDEAYKK